MFPNQIYYEVLLQVNVCGLTYGQAPCTATGGPGFECYNCFATCQDKPNYLETPQTISLGMNSTIQPIFDGGVRNAYQCLVGYPKYTPTLLKRGEGVAIRGGVDITAQDFVMLETAQGGMVDHHQSTRDNPMAGTFWGKFKARFPYYALSKVSIHYWEVSADGSDGALVDVLEYRLETIQGPDKSGNVVLKCRDVLTAIDKESAQIPEADGAALTASINPTATTIAINGYNAANWPAGGGVFVVEEEAVSYAARSGDNLTGCVRGVYGTDNSSHDADERAIISIVWDTVNVVDIIYDLLVNYAGIDPSYIAYNDNPGDPDEWDDEKAQHLAGYNITHVIYTPTSVSDALNAICEQAYINLWYEPKTAKIRISATNTGLASQTALPVSDTNNMIDGPVKLIERQKKMVSQSWYYYDKVSALADDSFFNYGEVDISVNTELESINAWGHKRVALLVGSWLYQGDNIAIITNSRIIDERSRPQYELTFQLDYKDSAIRTGQFINLRTDFIQGPDGNPVNLTWQVIKSKDVIPAAVIEVTVASIRPPLIGARFAKIVNVANESVEYGDATAPDRAAWGWIAAVDGFQNGDEPYISS